MGKKVGATPASLRQGYLVKEPVHGHALSAAKRRFFLLTEHKIEWYDSSRSIGATPKGYLFLHDAAVFRRGLPGHESDRLSIVSGRDELVLRLGPGNMPDELDGWQTMIDRQIQKLSGPSRRLSSRTSEHLHRRASIEALDLAAEPEQQLAIFRETAPSIQSEGGRSDGGAEPAYLDVVCNRLVSAKLGSGKCNSPTNSLCSAAGGLHRLVASENSEPTGRSAVRSPAASEESVGSVRAYDRLRGRMGSLAWRSEVVGAAEVKAADLQGLDLAVPRSRTASLVPSAAARTVDGDARERSSTTACAVGGTDGTQSRRPAPSTRLDACPRRGASSKWGASSGLVSAKNARTNAEVAAAVATAAPVSAQSVFAHPHRLWEGYLVKEPLNSRPKGNIIASARRRFFVLTPDAIEWHESDEVGSVPKGYLLLRGAQVYRRGLHGEELALTSGGDELLMRLAADSPPDALDKWEAALRTQIKAITERDAPGRGVRRSSVEAGERISTRRLSAGVERRSRLSSGGGKRTEMVWASPPVSRHSCAAPLEDKSPADSGCLWQGYLIKDPLHGNLLSQARRRFFLLTPVAIEWFESQEDVSIAKGNLRLRGAQVYRRGLQGEKLVLTSGADELVMRKGVWNRPEELDEWEAAIRKQIDTIRRGSDTVTAEVETVRIASASAEAKAVVVDAGAPSRSAAGRGAVAVTPVVVSTSPDDRGTAGRGDQARIDVVQARVARSHRRMEERAQHQLARGSVGRVDFKKAAEMIDFSAQLQLTGVSEITGEEEASVEVGRGRKILSKVHGVGVRGGPAASCDGGGRMQFADFGLSATVEDGTEEAMPESQVRKAFRKVSVAQSGPCGDMARDPLWVGFGLELVGMSLNEEEEAALDTQSKAALRAAYDLLARSSEATLSLELQALLNAHMQGVALSACVGLGLELAGLQLSTAEESMLDLFSRSALSTARVLLAHADLGGTGLAVELEAAIDTQARRGGVPSSWLGFGLELAQMNLSEADQAALDPQSRAALDVGILLHERLLNGHRLTPDETGRVLGVPFLPGLDSQGTAWLEFGLELIGLELNDEEVAQLEWQSAAALRGARLLRASDEYRTAAAAAGVLRTSLQQLSPFSRSRSVTHEWLHWGKELYALGLGPEEEEGLDSQSKAALGLVRLLALRETETLLPDNTSAWVDLGLELSGLELSLEEEAVLDALSRAALAACRVLEVRWMDDETQRQRGIKTSAWIELGMQLVGMSGEAEMELDSRSKAALQASRIVQNRQRAFCAANGRRVSGVIPSRSAQPISMAPLLASHQLEDIEDREAPLDTTNPKARAKLKGRQTPMRLEMVGAAIYGEELDGTHETEAPLDARQRGVPRRVHAGVSEESGVPTRDAKVQGMLAVQMEALPTSESLEIEAPLDASVRRAPKFSSSNCGQWAMTEGLSNMVEKEAPLDASVRGAGKRLAHQHAEPSSTEPEPLDFGTEAGRSWLSFAAEIIDSIELTQEEEAVLDSHTRQALQKVRTQRAKSGSKSVRAVEGSISAKECLPDLPVKAISPQNDVAAEDVSNDQVLQHTSCHRYEAEAKSTPWLSFGMELAEMDLSAEEESVLEPQVRAALHVARAVRIHDMSMIDQNTMAGGQARRGAPRLVGGPGIGGDVLESEQEAVAGGQGRRGAPRLVGGPVGGGDVLESEQEAVAGGQARRGAPRLVGGLGGGDDVLKSEQEAVAGGQARRGAPRLVGGPVGGDDVLESEQEAVAGGQARRGAPRLVGGPVGGDDVLESEQEAVAGGQARRGAPRMVGGPVGGDDVLESEKEAVAGGQARRGAPRMVGGPVRGGDVLESEQEAVAGGQARRGAPRLVGGPGIGGDVLESEQEALAGGQARRGAPRLVGGFGIGGDVLESEQESEQEAVAGGQARRGAPRLVAGTVGVGDVLESEPEAVAGGQGRRGAPRLVDGPGVGPDLQESEQDAFAGGQARQGAAWLVGGPVGGGGVLESEEAAAGGQGRRGAPQLVGGLGGGGDVLESEQEALAERQGRRRAPRLVGRLLGGVGLLKSEQEAAAGGQALRGAPRLVGGPVGGGDVLKSEQEALAGRQARRGAPRLVGGPVAGSDELESEQEAVAGGQARRGAPRLVGGPVAGGDVLESEQEAAAGGQARRGAPRLVGGLGGGDDVLESELEAVAGGQGRRGAPRLVVGAVEGAGLLESEQEAAAGGQGRRGAPRLVGGLGGGGDELESEQEAVVGGQARRGAPRLANGPGIEGDVLESEPEAVAGGQARRGAPRLVGDPVGGSDALESAQEGVTEGHARLGAPWLVRGPGDGDDVLESEKEAVAGMPARQGAPRLVGGPGRAGNSLEPEQEAAASNQARLEVPMLRGLLRSALPLFSLYKKELLLHGPLRWMQ
ncbi:hypothetical protein AB1Y20_001143 [Prymnesium parvum]|uniref:PH domain-containing protein n=1 Tax=Prymnesium parvum TaxID=97485 RepID=A0AB34KAE7_PRYPA